MTNSKDKIELRSEKVRNIIGQIPPKIIRIGITVIFLIIVILLLGVYFFKIDYSIKTKAYIEQVEDNFKIEILIPFDEKSKVLINQKCNINLDDIENFSHDRLQFTIDKLDSNIVIIANKAYCKAYSVLNSKTYTESRNIINFKTKATLNAEIYIGKVGILEYFSN